MRNKNAQKQNWNSTVYVSNSKKIEKLRMLGEHYLSQMHLMHLQPRFDVIAVQLAGKTTPEIDHFVNAF